VYLKKEQELTRVFRTRFYLGIGSGVQVIR
jgi:hypothetical protein